MNDETKSTYATALCTLVGAAGGVVLIGAKAVVLAPVSVLNKASSIVQDYLYKTDSSQCNSSDLYSDKSIDYASYVIIGDNSISNN